MTMLADQVDVVIGVDTHKHTNTAAVVRAATGGVLEEATVPTTPAGHQELLALARSHGPLRAWAIEGTSSYGTGLTRFLRANDEWVFELERPGRSDRRGGKKNDPLDAARSAREALARPELGEPRSTGDRSALAVLLSARRSAVDGATVAEKQILALLIAAPEALRERLRKLTTTATVKKAATMRIPTSGCDAEMTTTTTVVRSLARPSVDRAPLRGQRVRASAPRDHSSLASRSAGAKGRRADRRGDGALLVVAPRSLPLRGGVRQSRWSGTSSRVVGTHHPPPAQPTR